MSNDPKTSEYYTNTAIDLFRENTNDAVYFLICVLVEEGKQANTLTVYDKCLELEIKLDFEEIDNSFEELLAGGYITKLDE